MDLGGSVSLSLVFTLAGLLFIMIWKTISKRGRLPPGPVPLPFLGNMLQLKNSNMAQSIMQLHEKYGPVFTVYLGPRPVLVLCGFEAVKEALVDQGDDFSGRGDFAVLQMFSKGYGIVISNGERWKQLRRFALMTLRNFGMGKRSIEERIQEEAQFLLEELKKTKEMPFDPTFFFSKAVSNVICSVVFGNRFDYEDKKFLTLLRLLNENMRFMSSFWGQLLNLFPNIIQPLPGPHNQFLKNIKVLRRFVKEYIKEHQETLDPSSPRDFIDCFLNNMHQETQNPTSEFSIKNLVATTVNLFVAGTETVSTTLRYGLMIFMKHPEIEEKVQQEIDCVIGQNRGPCMEDRSKMPYTEAVIHEIQRFIDIFPMNVPHCVIRDTTFRGYSIPKGMKVLPMLTSVLFNHKKFEKPEHFDPKHFLDDNSNCKKNDAFVPFSAELPFDPTFFFSKAVSNVICSVVFGHRFDYEDKKFLTLLRVLNEILCFISSFWGQEAQNPTSEVCMKNLVMTTFNLLVAGTETVSTTLRYGLMIFMKHPEIEDVADWRWMRSVFLCGLSGRWIPMSEAPTRLHRPDGWSQADPPIAVFPHAFT